VLGGFFLVGGAFVFFGPGFFRVHFFIGGNRSARVAVFHRCAYGSCRMRLL
jgi:hypothetical protein